MTTLAFNNDPAQAERIRAQVIAHEVADEIVQGIYWENGKGCFIGCIAHSSSAEDAAGLLGGDLMLVRIAESIFEGLPNDQAKGFPARVILAPRVGADLSLVPWKFLHWCVNESLACADENTRVSCAGALDILARKAAGQNVTRAATNAAVYAAYAAAYAADAAAFAADAAAYAAAFAADAAARAADAAANAVAYAAAYAADAADATAYAVQADKLVELLAAAE